MSRLDFELVKRGLAQSRERAKEHIQNGEVIVNGRCARKPSDEVSENDDICLVGETLKYVGRGGLKLEKALFEFKINLSGRTCLDIGASTGGFTDCMLQNNACKVYAVDVGHGQLAEKLVNDPRVINIEGVNVKDICSDMFSELIDFICADLSFISVKYAADAARDILQRDGEAVLLIKPQFEAGKEHLSKGGIVKDKSVHVDVLKSLCAYFCSIGFEISGLIPSPIKGGNGNIEYLIHLVKRDCFTAYNIDFKELCGWAFASLKG